VVKLEVPSLNQRRDDIIPMAKHFLVEYSQKFEKSFIGISPEAEAALKEYAWPGNVRELKNLIERGVLLAEGPQLMLDDLGLKENNGRNNADRPDNGHHLPQLSPSGIDFSAIIEDIEKAYFEAALDLTGGNESRAALLLNLTRDKFRYRRQKLNGVRSKDCFVAHAPRNDTTKHSRVIASEAKQSKRAGISPRIAGICVISLTLNTFFGIISSTFDRFHFFKEMQ
jgi:DNA-binding NtrC family response regulator